MRFPMPAASLRNMWLVVAAISGFLTVAGGAFGAHGLKERMHLSPERLAVFETGVRYQMFHTLALALVAVMMERNPGRAARTAAWAFLVGIIVFSGSLYALALSDVKAWGAVTPLGGLSFLAGWVLLAIASYHPSE